MPEVPPYARQHLIPQRRPSAMLLTVTMTTLEAISRSEALLAPPK